MGSIVPGNRRDSNLSGSSPATNAGNGGGQSPATNHNNSNNTPAAAGGGGGMPPSSTAMSGGKGVGGVGGGGVGNASTYLSSANVKQEIVNNVFVFGATIWQIFLQLRIHIL